MSRRAGRLGTAVAVVLAAAWSGVGGAAVAAPAGASPRPLVGGPSLELVRQTISVELGSLATIGVKVTGAPEGAELDATVFQPVDLDGIRAARAGQLPGRQAGFVPRAPLGDLTVGDGSVAVALRAVDAAPQFDDEVRMPFPGIYPVRVRLLEPRRNEPLAELVTFLIRPSSARMPVTVVLPLPGAPAHRADGTIAVDDADLRRAEDVTNLMSALPTFPFTLAPRPELLDALATTKPVLTNRLGGALGSRTVLAMPYVRIDLPGLVAADLRDEISRQWKIGEDTTTRVLPGSRPDRRVWFLDSPVDRAAVDVLRTLGVQEVLVGADRLNPAPPTAFHPVPVTADTPTTATTPPADADGMLALTDDAAFTARLRAGASLPATVVDLVAELAAQAFGDDAGRGVLLMPSTTEHMDPVFWQAFARAIADAGMVEAVDLDAFLRRATPVRATTYTLVGPASRDELPLAQSLFVTRVALDVFGSVLSTGSPRFAGLTDRTTMAVSADLDDAARQAYFDTVTDRVNPVRGAVTVRVRDRVTLAGKSGVVPVSLVNALDEPVSVRVKLVSPKLEVIDNDQVVTVPAKGEKALRVEVRAVTSAWQFPVNVQLSTPVGGEAIGGVTQLQVRAVGLSGLGLGISAGALVVLAVWWLSHHRARRRARRPLAASLPDP